MFHLNEKALPKVVLHRKKDEAGVSLIDFINYLYKKNDLSSQIIFPVSSYQEPAKCSITIFAIRSPVLYMISAIVLGVLVQEVSWSSDRSRPVLTTFSIKQ